MKGFIQSQAKLYICFVVPKETVGLGDYKHFLLVKKA